MLTLETFAAAKGFSGGELAQYGVVELSRGGIKIPYRTAEGHAYIRYRLRKDAGEGKGFVWSQGDAPLIPYGLNRPVPASKGFLWIVEGESDCWALWLGDIPAIGVPGAKNAVCLKLEHLRGIESVGIVQEPDEAGEAFPSRVAAHLYNLGFTGRCFAIPMPQGFKDPRAVFVADRAQFRERMHLAYRGKRELPRPKSTAPTVSPGLLSVSMADVFDLPEETVDWLVEGLIPAGGVTLLAAKPKSGKSVLARNLALAVARGKRFLGRPCKGGAVLWVALEERSQDVIGAFKAMGAQSTDPIRFYFGSSPGDAAAWLQRECSTHDISLVVLDTWHKLTLIEDINAYAAVNRANEPLMRLSREHGIAQVWVHHNNKGESDNGDEVLGSSALFASADTLLSVKRANDGSRTVRSIQRFGTDMEPTILAMDPDTYLIQSAGSKYAALVTNARLQLERAFELNHEPMTRDEIVQAVEARRQITLAALNELLEGGTIVKVSGTGRKGDPARFGFISADLPDMSESTKRDHLYSSIGGSRVVIGTTGTGNRILDSGSHDSGTSTEHQESLELPEPQEPEWRVQVGHNGSIRTPHTR